jgi:hypothetical protein
MLSTCCTGSSWQLCTTSRNSGRSCSANNSTEPVFRSNSQESRCVQVRSIKRELRRDEHSIHNLARLSTAYGLAAHLRDQSLRMASAVQIVKTVEPLHVGQFMFVRIVTDQGLTGYGEAGIWGHIATAATAITRFAEYLIGKNAFDIEHHWNVMHRFSYFQGLAINAAISAIDIALWDIKGKALGVPVYELLGGACRTKARVYGHIYENTIEKVLAECKRKKDLGYTAFGHINPFLDVSPSPVLPLLRVELQVSRRVSLTLIRRGPIRHISKHTSERCRRQKTTSDACVKWWAMRLIC